jgi:hypothetical protein
LLAFLVLHVYELPNRLSAFRKQSTCLSLVASDPCDKRLKETISAFLCGAPIGTSLPWRHFPPTFSHSVSLYGPELAPSSASQRSYMTCINYETFLQIKF